MTGDLWMPGGLKVRILLDGATTGGALRVVVFSPAGIEGFFREVGHGEPAVEHDLGAVLHSATEHGWRF